MMFYFNTVHILTRFEKLDVYVKFATQKPNCTFGKVSSSISTMAASL